MQAVVLQCCTFMNKDLITDLYYINKSSNYTAGIAVFRRLFGSDRNGTSTDVHVVKTCDFEVKIKSRAKHDKNVGYPVNMPNDVCSMLNVQDGQRYSYGHICDAEELSAFPVFITALMASST